MAVTASEKPVSFLQVVCTKCHRMLKYLPLDVKANSDVDLFWIYCPVCNHQQEVPKEHYMRF